MIINSTPIEVAIALPIDNTFIYEVPEVLFPLVSIGKRVLAPFGRRRVTGYILGPAKKSDMYKMKQILDVLDEKPLFPSSMIPFFKWIADYYMHPLGNVIHHALPRGLNFYDFVTVSITDAGKAKLADKALPPLQKEVLRRLEQGTCRLKALCKNFDEQIPNALIHTMEKYGWIVKKKELAGGSTKPRMERYVSLKGADIPSLKNLSPKKRKIIDILSIQGEMSVKNLNAQVPKASRFIGPLEKAAHISVFHKNVYRDPFGDSINPDTPPTLTEEQKKAVSKIVSGVGKGFAAYLLAGVTGSGKTEVYMQVAAEVVGKGRSVVVLVPEIALMSQMERRFRARFGERIAVLHSRLSAGERYDQWTRILNDEVAIAIGARSAIFAPFSDIGLIIVDEEHDTSYKQENDFPYNARDIAVVRAKLSRGIALMGSATPSLQSCHNVTAKKFIQVSLNERIEKRPLPTISVVDLRKIRDQPGIRRFITPELYQAMKETFERKEQILIFLNRRGFAGFPLCAACGEPVRCENCDVTLTLHQAINAYKCHYCGFTRAYASKCPTCDSASIKLLGLGTEKVEAAITSLFPDARVARMDRDTTTRKGSILKILKDIRNHDTDILVGTQMVVKGHDFPNITLVGIICADLSLGYPDFRAGERTFQLLAQVSGRAGRGNIPGRVVLQTYNPDHFSIVSAVAQDFKAFYDTEITFRKALDYPPFSRLTQLKISGKDKERTRAFVREMGLFCENLRKRDPLFLTSVQILGPIEASIFKMAKQYRWQILLKGSDAGSLHRFVREMKTAQPAMFHHPNIKVIADVDPFFMF